MTTSTGALRRRPATVSPAIWEAAKRGDARRIAAKIERNGRALWGYVWAPSQVQAEADAARWMRGEMLTPLGLMRVCPALEVVIEAVSLDAACPAIREATQ